MSINCNSRFVHSYWHCTREDYKSALKNYSFVLLLFHSLRVRVTTSLPRPLRSILANLNNAIWTLFFFWTPIPLVIWRNPLGTVSGALSTIGVCGWIIITIIIDIWVNFLWFPTPLVWWWNRVGRVFTNGPWNRGSILWEMFQTHHLQMVFLSPSSSTVYLVFWQLFLLCGPLNQLK